MLQLNIELERILKFEVKIEKIIVN